MGVICPETEAVPQAIDLLGRQRLTIVRRSGDGGAEDVLQLIAADGTTTLTLHVGSEGTQVELGTASLTLRVAGALTFDAEQISLHGRQGISISTGADLVLRSGAKLLAQAESQRFVATRGDVSVYANDDVKIDGERIRMNC